MQNGGWYNGQQFWNGQLGPVGQIINPGQSGYKPVGGGSSGGGGGGQSMPSQGDIDSAFSGVYSGLDAITGTLQKNAAQATSTAQQEESNALGLIPGQQAQLQDTLNQNKTQWAQGTQSAYGDALNSYNALQQRNQGLFGGQSSASSAANDFLNQEYLKTRGQIGNEDQSAQLQFGTQNQNIQNWVAQSTTQVKNWYLDASQQIQNQLSQGLSQIQEQRGQTQTDQAMAKLNLVSTLVQHQQALDTMAAQTQQYMQLAASSGGMPNTQAPDYSQFYSGMGNNLAQVQGMGSGFSQPYNGSSKGITPNFNPGGGPTLNLNQNSKTGQLSLPGLKF